MQASIELVTKLKSRVVDETKVQAAITAGLSPIIARIIASRPLTLGDDVLRSLSPRLSDLDSPLAMQDMDKAIARLLRAIAASEVIALETDHDCDGQTSHAVLWTALVEDFGYPRDKVQSFIGHRLIEGYGLSNALVERILQASPRPTLVITADNGSTDEPRIARLKAEGIDVIVTDHHEIPLDGIPKSAVAVLNPTRTDCSYPDPYIAGCMVAWLFMASIRPHIPGAPASLAHLLDFVAVGTVADCVSIARSRNNRAVVPYGLRHIALKKRACWRAMAPLWGDTVTAEDLGFKVAPLLNSDGRLDSALGSVSFLLATSDAEAAPWMVHLQAYNAQRKAIQKEITLQATILAEAQVQAGRQSLCVFLESGHPGVHGIAASRIKDAFGRPTIIFSPKQGHSDLLTGSGRSIDTVHMRTALETISGQHAGLMVSFGGHRGAAGVTIPREALETFSGLFEQAVYAQLGIQTLYPFVWTDGPLPVTYFDTSFVDQLEMILAPFGREFEAPIFEAAVKIVSIHPVGDGTHARLQCVADGQPFEAIWFGARADPMAAFSIAPGDMAQIAFSPKNNVYKGRKAFNPHVVFCQKID